MDLDTKKQESTGPAAAEKAPIKVFDLLCQNVHLLEEAVHAKETSLCMGRLMRQTSAARKRMTEHDIAKLLKTKLPNSNEVQQTLAQFLDLTVREDAKIAMETDDNKENDAAAEAVNGTVEGGKKEEKTSAATATPVHNRPTRASAVPECEIYVFLLAILKLLDSGSDEKARELSGIVVDWLQSFNRRTMDSLAARIYAYFSWSHERCGDDHLQGIRSKLLTLQRTAILRHDEIGQETLLNLLLHNYLHFSLYDHADKLRSKTQLTSNQHRNVHQFCRYLFYIGKIRAIQLDYTESKEKLQQALRKVPSGAKGFRITLHKWLCMVHLLLGEIPERTHFTTPGMRRALKPYFSLTQAIRKGDLKTFQQVAQRHWDQFMEDKTHNLIVRLQHNVIRTGLRNISKAYSRVSLEDVSKMLGLSGGIEEVECIVAKAVRDGAIEAKIDHANKWMTTNEASDIYSTFEPQQAFHSRIMFCLNLHNEAVKAMRYKPKEQKDKDSAEEARKERLQQEQTPQPQMQAPPCRHQ